MTIPTDPLGSTTPTDPTASTDPTSPSTSTAPPTTGSSISSLGGSNLQITSTLPEPNITINEFWKAVQTNLGYLKSIFQQTATLDATVLTQLYKFAAGEFTSIGAFQSQLQATLEEDQALLEATNIVIDRHNTNATNLSDAVSQYNTAVSDMNQAIADYNQAVDIYNQASPKTSAVIQDYNLAVSTFNAAITSYNSALANINQKINDYNSEIPNLQSQLDQINQVNISRGVDTISTLPTFTVPNTISSITDPNLQSVTSISETNPPSSVTTISTTVATATLNISNISLLPVPDAQEIADIITATLSTLTFINASATQKQVDLEDLSEEEEEANAKGITNPITLIKVPKNLQSSGEPSSGLASIILGLSDSQTEIIMSRTLFKEVINSFLLELPQNISKDIEATIALAIKRDALISSTAALALLSSVPSGLNANAPAAEAALGISLIQRLSSALKANALSALIEPLLQQLPEVEKLSAEEKAKLIQTLGQITSLVIFRSSTELLGKVLNAKDFSVNIFNAAITATQGINGTATISDIFNVLGIPIPLEADRMRQIISIPTIQQPLLAANISPDLSSSIAKTIKNAIVEQGLGISFKEISQKVKQQFKDKDISQEALNSVFPTLISSILAAETKVSFETKLLSSIENPQLAETLSIAMTTALFGSSPLSEAKVKQEEALFTQLSDELRNLQNIKEKNFANLVKENFDEFQKENISLSAFLSKLIEPTSTLINLINSIMYGETPATGKVSLGKYHPKIIQA